MHAENPNNGSDISIFNQSIINDLNLLIVIKEMIYMKFNNIFKILINLKFNNTLKSKMNPFEKLKLTIDRVGLQYLPSNDYPSISGQTVNKFSRQAKSNYEQNEVLNVRPQNQGRFLQRRQKFVAEQLQQLKLVSENQQKNYINEINLLNKNIQKLQQILSKKQRQTALLDKELEQKSEQNLQLRSHIISLQQKLSSKASQSFFMDREHKLKQQIQRINLTTTELTKALNNQTITRKTINKELELVRKELKQKEQQIDRLKIKGDRDVTGFKEELQMRVEMLQYSIKKATEDKVQYKNILQDNTGKYQAKIQYWRAQLDKIKDQNSKLNLQLSITKNQRDQVSKQLNKAAQSMQKTQVQLSRAIQQNHLNQSQISQLQCSLQQSSLQHHYLQSQLNEQRSNTKVKVIQIRDQGLQMQLEMYKRQCKELKKEKTLWDMTNGNGYTIVGHEQMLLQRDGE